MTVRTKAGECNVCGEENGACVPFVRCANYPEHDGDDSMLNPACDGCGVIQSWLPTTDLCLWVTWMRGTARHMNRVELCGDCACTDRSAGL